ncbi:hypothetical protein D3C81_578580 [compost metagenome]
MLQQNGSMAGVEAIFCKCAACGDESRLSRGRGLQETDEGVLLTCLACSARGVIPTAKIWADWGEQLRRDRIVALAGMTPEDLNGP